MKRGRRGKGSSLAPGEILTVSHPFTGLYLIEVNVLISTQSLVLEQSLIVIDD